MLKLNFIIFLPFYIATTTSKYECLEEECGLIEDAVFNSPYSKSMGSLNSSRYFFPSSALLTINLQCHNNDKPELSFSNTCSGALIDHFHILTAAHCVFVNVTEYFQRCQRDNPGFEHQANWLQIHPENIIVQLGTYDLDNPTGEENVQNGVEKFTLPGEFDRNDINVRIPKKDVALIKLKQRVEFSSAIRAVCIPHLLPVLNDYFLGLGQLPSWGSIGEAYNETTKQHYFIMPRTQRQLTVPIISASECQKHPMLQQMGFHPSIHVCAGGRGRGILEGDSGAPLLTENAGKWFIVGIASMRMNTQEERNVLPDIYTRITSLCDFLRDQIGHEICVSFGPLSQFCQHQLQQKREKAIARICQPNEKRKCSSRPLPTSGITNANTFYDRRCIGCDVEQCLNGECLTDVCTMMGLFTCKWTDNTCLYHCAIKSDGLCLPFHLFTRYSQIRAAPWKQKLQKQKKKFQQLFFARGFKCNQHCDENRQCTYQGICSNDGQCIRKE